MGRLVEVVWYAWFLSKVVWLWQESVWWSGCERLVGFRLREQYGMCGSLFSMVVWSRCPGYKGWVGRIGNTVGLYMDLALILPV